MLKIKIQGLDTMNKKLTKRLESLVADVAESVLESAKTHTPYRSGNARSNWDKRLEKDTFSVSNRVPYIERLENNWSKQTRGKGIIKPTLTDIKRKYK